MRNPIATTILAAFSLVMLTRGIQAQEIFYNHHTLERLSLERGDMELDQVNDFYADPDPVIIRLETDLTHLKDNKEEKDNQSAVLHVRFTDSVSMRCEVKVRPRGKSRLEYCFLPPLKIDFTESGLQATNLRQLEKVKLVSKCRRNDLYEDYVLSEFLAYKLYHVITPVSFRARLAKITFVDTGDNGNEWTDYGFIIEETDAVARRVNLRETEGLKGEISEEHALTLSMFQYMIGNIDWHVPTGHNVKYFLDPTRGEKVARVIPYDFDLSGMVKANYAAPRPELSQTSSRQRRFIGFTPDEELLDRTISLFQDKRTDLYRVIEEFDPMPDKNKKDLVKYLDSFYKIIDDPKKARKCFIEECIGFNW